MVRRLGRCGFPLWGCCRRGFSPDAPALHHADIARAVACVSQGFAGDDIVKVDSKAGRAKVFQTIKAESDRVRGWAGCAVAGFFSPSSPSRFLHAPPSQSITFIDLCGHEKYLKTTIFGLTVSAVRPWPYSALASHRDTLAFRSRCSRRA